MASFLPEGWWTKNKTPHKPLEEAITPELQEMQHNIFIQKVQERRMKRRNAPKNELSKVFQRMQILKHQMNLEIDILLEEEEERNSPDIPPFIIEDITL